MTETQGPYIPADNGDLATYQQLRLSGLLIQRGARIGLREFWKISMGLRLAMQVRRKLNEWVVLKFLSVVLKSGTLVHSRIKSYMREDDELDTEINPRNFPPDIFLLRPMPVLEMFCYLVVLIFLIDQRRYIKAKSCASDCIFRLKNSNWRSVDLLAPKLYFYYSLVYELTGDLAEIRRNLFSLHRIATQRQDKLGQETLLNLIVRNYLHYNLYHQAHQLMSVAPGYQTFTNQQLSSRHLFYSGKVKAIRLEYTDAKDHLLQAVQNAPVAALGFRVQCNKWAIIVHLLLGEIPKRTVFMQKGIKNALRPYFELTKAVRIGDLELFRTVAGNFADVFRTDKVHNLIVRLRHNVIRTRLRNISLAYSRISLFDIANKLHLDSANPVADVESIIAKAIRDGAIDATLDHANGHMISKEPEDIYSTYAPTHEFSSRIAFCLDIHNDAVRAHRFPRNFGRLRIRRE